MLEDKMTEKIGFRAKNCESVETLANWLNRLRVLVDRFPFPS